MLPSDYIPLPLPRKTLEFGFLFGTSKRREKKTRYVEAVIVRMEPI